MLLAMLACFSPYRDDEPRYTRADFAADLAAEVCADREPCEPLADCLERLEAHYAAACLDFDPVLADQCVEEAAAQEVDRCDWPPRPLPRVCGYACGL